LTNVLLIFPSFNPNSFWSFRSACEISGARWPAPPLGLITVAALLPQDWALRLIDRNVEPLTDEDWTWADLVLTGGMLPQRFDALATIARAKAMGTPVCVGGPDPTSSPHIYAHADFLVLGEAEGIIDEFIAAWNSGARSGRFEAAKFRVDVVTSPIPRYDLLTFKNYLYIGVQFSRGCPFNCEFCDIIELYGRVPRTKTNMQMLRELDQLYELGLRGHVDFVDDNLIGNKKALKAFLPDLLAWQKRRKYPFKFSTEASINLADDPDLLSMLRAANFFAVFIGIESPNAETLIATQKKQNTGRSLKESVYRIYDAGLFVLAGFIIGFDTEDDRIADGMIDCIKAIGIPVCMVGLLTALPNTQLTRRLEREGRLNPSFDDILREHGDQCTAGINFIPLRPRREILLDYRRVLTAIYEPRAYFERVSKSAAALRASDLAGMLDRKALAHNLGFIMRLSRLIARERKVATLFWRCILACIRFNPAAIEYVATMTALYLHLADFASHVVVEIESQIAAVDADVNPTPRRAS
jgi:radical SAM superfamily enzyme YgiQ (UPF0313 family)